MRCVTALNIKIETETCRSFSKPFFPGATDPDTVEKRLLFTFMRKYYGKDTKENNKEKEDDKV